MSFAQKQTVICLTFTFQKNIQHGIVTNYSLDIFLELTKKRLFLGVLPKLQQKRGYLAFKAQ